MKKFFISLVILSMVPFLLLGAEKKYDKVVRFSPLVFDYDKMDKNSKLEFIEVIETIQTYQSNSEKMKVEIQYFSNEDGEENAETVKDELTKNGIKKKRIKYKSYYLKGSDSNINNVSISLYVNLDQDKDKDGVMVADDKCPNTPSGYEVDSVGCAIPDKDQDGIMVADDKCPNTPLGYEVDESGCTVPDKDNDGVMIENDMCPNTPQGYDVDKLGCTIPDKDEDGVMIENDKCLDTPLGERVGNDGCSLSTISILITDKQTIKILKKNDRVKKSQKVQVQTLYYNESGFDKDSRERLESLFINLGK